MNLIRNQLYPSKTRFYWIWWEMSSGQTKPFSLWLNTEFEKKWAISAQGHILKDSLLNLMRNGSYPSKATFLRISYKNQLEMSYIHWMLNSLGFLIEFDEKWATSSHSSFLNDFLLDLIRNESYPDKAVILMILYCIW